MKRFSWPSHIAVRASVAVAAALPSTPSFAEAPALAGSALQAALGLAVVVICIFAGLALLKKLTAPRGAASGVLRVVTAASVGPRERVVVMEVGDQWLVLGVAPGQVRTLHTLARQALPADANAPAGSPEFSAWLRRAMARKP